MKYKRFDRDYIDPKRADTAYYQKLLKYLKENNNREYLINYIIKDKSNPKYDEIIVDEGLVCKDIHHARTLLEREHKKVFITSFLPIEWKDDEISLFEVELYDREWNYKTTHQIIANNYDEASDKIVKEVCIPRWQHEVNYHTYSQEIEVFRPPDVIDIKRFIHVGEVDPNANLLKFLND